MRQPIGIGTSLKITLDDQFGLTFTKKLTNFMLVCNYLTLKSPSAWCPSLKQSAYENQYHEWSIGVKSFMNNLRKSLRTNKSKILNLCEAKKMNWCTFALCLILNTEVTRDAQLLLNTDLPFTEKFYWTFCQIKKFKFISSCLFFTLRLEILIYQLFLSLLSILMSGKTNCI